ncbi:hypothetical protein OROHE_023864 [Orobanche hederae]
MSIKLNYHIFAGNPINKHHQNDIVSHSSAFKTLKDRILNKTHDLGVKFEVLAFRKDMPLAGSVGDELKTQNCHLGWLNLRDFRGFLDESWGNFTENEFGRFSASGGAYHQLESAAAKLAEKHEITLALMEAKRRIRHRSTCTFMSTNSDFYRVDIFLQTIDRMIREMKDYFSEANSELLICIACLDPRDKFSKFDTFILDVVIMLVIDKQNDRALLSRQQRFVTRMWSCLAGFIEESSSSFLYIAPSHFDLSQEKVWKKLKETLEETGIEVGEVIYHSSQPWPVGPSSMPCRLMVGFFAYAKSLEINVDKEELDDAKWHSREDIKKALTFAEYEKAQKTSPMKVNQMCKGVERSQSLSADFNVESES